MLYGVSIIGVGDTIDQVAKIYNIVSSIRLITIKQQNGTTISITDEIRRYKQLMDEGTITEDEFNEKRKVLLLKDD